MANVRAGTKVIMMTLAVVGVMATAVVGVPWATGDPPTGTGGGGSGGGGPPGGIADAPEGASMDDGLWSATVGGTEYAGLGAGDVGKLLWRGGKVTRTYVDDAGIPRTTQVCESFPEIRLSGSGHAAALIDAHASVDLSFESCTATLSELTHTTTGIPSAPLGPQPSPTGLAWPTGMDVVAIPIAFRTALEDFRSPDWRATSSAPTRLSRLTMKMKAVGDGGFMLTMVELYGRYETTTLTPRGFRVVCDADSPSFILGIKWHEDDCDGSQTLAVGRQVKTRGKGWFHGEARAGASFIGSTRHTLEATLQGYRSSESYGCRFAPPSIMNLRARYAGITAGVRFDCRYGTNIRR